MPDYDVDIEVDGLPYTVTVGGSRPPEKADLAGVVAQVRQDPKHQSHIAQRSYASSMSGTVQASTPPDSAKAQRRQRLAQQIATGSADLGITPQDARQFGTSGAVELAQDAQNPLATSIGNALLQGSPFANLTNPRPAPSAALQEGLRRANAKLATQPVSTGIWQAVDIATRPGLGVMVNSAYQGLDPSQVSPSVVAPLLDAAGSKLGMGDTSFSGFTAKPGFFPAVSGGLASFAEPDALATMAIAGPALAPMGKLGHALSLGAFGAPVAAEAVQKAREGDYGGAAGSVAAFMSPFALHAALPKLSLGQAATGLNPLDYSRGAVDALNPRNRSSGMSSSMEMPPPNPFDPNIPQRTLRPSSAPTEVYRPRGDTAFTLPPRSVEGAPYLGFQPDPMMEGLVNRGQGEEIPQRRLYRGSGDVMDAIRNPPPPPSAPQLLLPPPPERALLPAARPRLQIEPPRTDFTMVDPTARLTPLDEAHQAFSTLLGSTDNAGSKAFTRAYVQLRASASRAGIDLPTIPSKGRRAFYEEQQRRVSNELRYNDGFQEGVGQGAGRFPQNNVGRAGRESGDATTGNKTHNSQPENMAETGFIERGNTDNPAFQPVERGVARPDVSTLDTSPSPAVHPNADFGQTLFGLHGVKTADGHTLMLQGATGSVGEGSVYPAVDSGGITRRFGGLEFNRSGNGYGREATPEQQPLVEALYRAAVRNGGSDYPRLTARQAEEALSSKSGRSDFAPVSEPEIPKTQGYTGVEKSVAEPLTFVTSKGSQYTFDAQGNTTRLKKSEGRGQGEVHPRSPVVFISPEGANELLYLQGSLILAKQDANGNWFQQVPKEGEKIEDNGTLHILVKNRQSGEIEGGAKATTTPEIGKHPVEISYREMNPNGTQNKSVHIGNRIVEINRPSKSATPSEFAPVSEPEIPKTQGYMAGKRVKPETPTEPTPAGNDLLATGSEGVAHTADKTAVPYRYALAPLDSLVPSQTDALSDNPRYDRNLQPRDRERGATAEQVSSETARMKPSLLGDNPLTNEGAPILSAHDMQIESGNGRTLGLRHARANEPAKWGEYQDWLHQNAERFGLDPAQVEAAQRAGKSPVLVRVRQGSEGRASQERYDMARRMGERTGLAMSESENAANDARILHESGALQSLQSGSVTSAANRPFMQRWLAAVPEAERGALWNDGKLTAAGARRLSNAVKALAYDDPQTLQRLTEDLNTEKKNLGRAMEDVAPQVARTRQTHPHLDISQNLSDAANAVIDLRGKPHNLTPEQAKAVRTRSEGLSPQVAEHIDNNAGSNMFGESGDPVTTELMKLMDRNSRSAGRITRTLEIYHELASKGSDGGLLGGEAAPASKLELLKRAVELAKSDREGDTLFEGESIPTVEPERSAPAPKTANAGGGGGLFDRGGATATAPSKQPATVRPIELPEMVSLAKELIGKFPEIAKLRNAYGVFRANAQNPSIQIDPKTAFSNEQLSHTLAHEIGHAVDFLPDGTMSRGNILGRLASLMHYMKSTLDAVPTDPSQALTPADIEGIRKQAQEEAKARPDGVKYKAAYQEAYTRLREEAVNSRNLVTKEEIHKELWDMSQWWREVPANAGEKHMRYRQSSKELYADAFSVLLNAPAEFQARAPKTWEVFHRYLGEKADVQDAYNEIQDRLGHGDAAVYDQRSADIRAGFDRGAEAYRSAVDARNVDKQTWGQKLASLFSDNTAAVTQLEKKAGRRDPFQRSASMAMDDLNAKDNKSYLMLSDLQSQAVEPLNEIGVSNHDMGEFLFARRIADGGRKTMGEEFDVNSGKFVPVEGDIANPYGHTPETAQATLDGLKNKLGDTMYAELEDRMKAFDAQKEKVLEYSYRAGIIPDDMMETVRENMGNYAAFAVVDHIGDYVSSTFSHQIGTFKDTGNPLDFTVMKLIALNRAADVNMAKRAVLVDFMEKEFSDDIKRLKSYPGGTDPRPGKGKATTLYLDKGKPVWFETDPYVAKVFNRTDYGTLQTVSSFISVLNNRIFHPLYITYNTLFQAKNLLRDANRTYRNVGGIGGGEQVIAPALGLAKGYQKSFKPAFQAGFGDVAKVPQTRSMLEEGSLTQRFVSSRGDVDTPYEDMLRKYNLLEANGKPTPKFIQGVKNTLEFVHKFGESVELWGKLGANEYLKTQGLSDADRVHAVRNFVSTPNHLKRGEFSPISNSLFMYSNIAIQGYAADAALAVRPKTAAGFWLRSALVTGLPTLAAVAAAKGVFGPAVQGMMNKAGEQDRKNYNVIPLGLTSGKGKTKVAILRLPPEDTERDFRSALYEAAMGHPASAFEALSSPFHLNPLGTMGGAWKGYLSGQNPMNSFRGKPIIADKNFKAGGGAAFEDMARWTADQFGVIGTAVKSFFPKHSDQSINTLDKVVQMSGAFQPFLKITDQGDRDAEFEAKQAVESKRAQVSTSLSQDTQDLVSEWTRLNSVKQAGTMNAEQTARFATVNAWYRDHYIPYRKMLNSAAGTAKTGIIQGLDNSAKGLR